MFLHEVCESWIYYYVNYLSKKCYIHVWPIINGYIATNICVFCDTVGHCAVSGLTNHIRAYPISDKYCSLLCVFLGVQNCAHRITEVILNSNYPCLSSNVLWRYDIKLDFSSCRNNYLNFHNRVTQLKIGMVFVVSDT